VMKPSIKEEKSSKTSSSLIIKVLKK